MLTEQKPAARDFQAAGFSVPSKREHCGPERLARYLSSAAFLASSTLSLAASATSAALLGGIGRVLAFSAASAAASFALAAASAAASFRSPAFSAAASFQVGGLLGSGRPSGRPPYRQIIGANASLDVLAGFLHLIDETHGESPFIGSCACIHHTVPQPSPPRDELIRR